MSTTDMRGLRWFKSTRSGGQGGNCVEVAATDTAWHVRDSKNPSAGMLSVAPVSWRAFIGAVRIGHRQG